MLPRALAVRALLHLPRVASHEGRLTRRDVQRELKVSADRLHRDVRAARDHVSREAFDLGELLFEKVDSSHALPILTLLHYLRSARPGSQYFALVDPSASFQSRSVVCPPCNGNVSVII